MMARPIPVPARPAMMTLVIRSPDRSAPWWMAKASRPVIQRMASTVIADHSRRNFIRRKGVIWPDLFDLLGDVGPGWLGFVQVA